MQFIFLDIEKAFETLDRNILMEKYITKQSITISKIYRSYCDNIMQKVRIGPIESDINEISKRDPQGAILGPLFF